MVNLNLPWTIHQTPETLDGRWDYCLYDSRGVAVAKILVHIYSDKDGKHAEQVAEFVAKQVNGELHKNTFCMNCEHYEYQHYAWGCHMCECKWWANKPGVRT